MFLEMLKKSAFFIVIGVVLIVFFFMKDFESANSASDFSPITTTQQEKDSNKEEENGNVIVDVKGEVLRPGVYEINADARVNDVIQLAGGFSEKADQTMVNLAQKVQDEMSILIPKIGEVQSSTKGEKAGNSKLKINYATQEEIERLNGIGPSKAAAIIQYREENGFFKTIDDLLQVSGIGEKTLENLKDDIQIP